MSKSYVPLYPYSYEESIRNGNTEEYQKSHKENIACAKAIKQGIDDNYSDNRLNTDFLKDVVKDFGYDRVLFVCINTIKHYDYDGRISRDNKEWAKTFFIPENIYNGMDYNREFLINSHLGLVDLAANKARQLFDDLNLWNESHCINPLDLDFTDKVMVLKPSVLKDEYKNPDCQLFYCKSGFGCFPTARGQRVFGEYLIDGEKTSYERSDFVGQLKPELLPKWAKDKLKDLQKPSIKKQLADMPTEKPKHNKNIDKGAR